MYDLLASASEGIECEVIAFIYICKWSWQGLVHWNLPSIDTSTSETDGICWKLLPLSSNTYIKGPPSLPNLRSQSSLYVVINYDSFSAFPLSACQSWGNKSKSRKK